MVNRVVTTVVGGALKVLGSTLKGAGSLVSRTSGTSKSPKSSAPKSTAPKSTHADRSSDHQP